MTGLLTSLRESRRLLNFVAGLYCAGLLGYGYYLQFHDGLDPCPLCIFQRIAFLGTGLLFFAAAAQAPGRIGSRIYAILITLAGLTGAGIAGRHLWLQSLPPDRVPECGPGLEYMLEVFPLTETLKMVFTGSGECAEVSWTFLGLSMPGWALLNFLGLVAAGILLNWRTAD
ncbi:MAG: disulfide bond formation protein B [Gammaproteobacteria bacterium]|nr:MAG: disulfide bond formation protein B [Gammaproteobacteria bacterium]